MNYHPDPGGVRRIIDVAVGCLVWLGTILFCAAVWAVLSWVLIENAGRIMP